MGSLLWDCRESSAWDQVWQRHELVKKYKYALSQVSCGDQEVLVCTKTGW